MLEKEIQKSITDYLEVLEAQGKLYFFRANSGSFTTKRKDGSSGYVKTGKQGCPDIVICTSEGQFLGVEVKTLTGKQTASQIEACKQIVALGGEYLLVRSLFELIHDFKTLKIIK